MSKKAFERVSKLVSTLTFLEKKAVVRTINSTRKENSKSSKLLELFVTIQHQSELSYPVNRKLVELLENRILDCLLLDVNLCRDTENCPSGRLSIKLLKETLKSRVLLERGVLKRSFEVAEVCLRSAVKVEDYDTTLRVLHQQVSMTGVYKNQEDYFKKIAQIDYYENCRSTRIKAVRLFQELSVKKYHGIYENLDLFVDSSLLQLKKFKSKYSFSTLEFVNLYFQKEQHELRGDMLEAFLSTINLYERCSSDIEPVLLYSLYELVFEQARLGYELEHFDESVFLLEKCVRFLPMENISSQRAYEMLFLIKFLNKNYEDAYSIIIELKESYYFQSLMTSVVRSRWGYYEACLFFRMGNFNKCIRSISTGDFGQLPPIDKLRIRFLSVMAYIELVELDLADRLIEATRKFVKRSNLNVEMESSSLHYFMNILFDLKTCSYDFEKAAMRITDLSDKIEFLRLSKQSSGCLGRWLTDCAHWLSNKFGLDFQEDSINYWFADRRECYYATGKLIPIKLN